MKNKTIKFNMTTNKPFKRVAILITHGTDTLAWTHAAVRYAVKNNPVNIAITGRMNN